MFRTIVRHNCASDDNTRLLSVNDTEEDINNRSVPFDWPLTNRISGKRSYIYI